MQNPEWLLFYVQEKIGADLLEAFLPLILPQELEYKWLNPIEDELDVKSVKELIKEYPDEELDAYTLRRLRGKEYIGNVEKVSEFHEYAELKAL